MAITNVKTVYNQPTSPQKTGPNATTQNGGVNVANETKYLTNLYNTGNSGQKSFAINQAKQYGINLPITQTPTAPKTQAPATPTAPKYTNNDVKYWTNLYNTGNPGEKSWAINQAKSKGYVIPGTQKAVSTTGLPKDLSSLMTPQQIAEYSNKYADNIYENEVLGYNQNIDLYKQQMGQLYTDAQIQEQAKRMGELQFRDVFTGLENEKNNANTNYQNTLQNANFNYEKAINQIKELSNEQRGRNLNDASRRGLYNSSVLSQTNAMTDKNEIDSITSTATEHNNNITMIDRELNNLMANLDNRFTSLTKDQQDTIVGRIDQLTKERNDEKDKLNLAISQQNQLISQAGRNKVQNGNEQYQKMYMDYAGLWRDDRQFKEGQRQFNLNYELDKKKINSYNNFTPWSYSNPTGGTPKTTTKEYDSNGMGSYSRADADNIAKQRGLPTPSDIEKMYPGQGPLDPAYVLEQEAKKKNNNPLGLPSYYQKPKSNDALMKQVFPWKK